MLVHDPEVKSPQPEDEKGYIEVATISMFVGSWNVAGEVPDISVDLSKWIKANGSELPYIAVPV